MNVILLNGSPRKNGNCALSLQEMEKIFHSENIETEIVQVGSQRIPGCVACNGCAKLGKCVFDDLVNETAPKLARCDGLVVASPVYYASANATLMAFLTRLFYSSHINCTMKVGAALSTARRSGTTATFDELNKFFAINGMPIATGQYWNGIHGRGPGEAAADEEGMQMLRTLARNMTFLMKSIALGKDAYGLPQQEAPIRTNFIR